MSARGFHPSSPENMTVTPFRSPYDLTLVHRFQGQQCQWPLMTIWPWPCFRQVRSSGSVPPEKLSWKHRAHLQSQGLIVMNIEQWMGETEIVDLEKQRTCWSENAFQVEVEGKPVTNQKSSGRWERLRHKLWGARNTHPSRNRPNISKYPHLRNIHSFRLQLSLDQMLVVCNAQRRKAAVCQTTQHWGLRVQPGYWKFNTNGQGSGFNHILMPGPSLLLG